MVILDECHALSKAAWQPLLKLLEEPPTHLFVCLCTTEASKVPLTIRTRCAEYNLPPLSRQVLLEYLDALPETQTLPDAIKTALVAYAEGSMRRMLTGADKVIGVSDVQVAQKILSQMGDEADGAGIGIARILASGRWSWERLSPLVATVEESEVESVRRIVLAYLTKACLGKASEAAAGPLVNSLSAFSQPFNCIADLIVALFIAGGRS
jgi:DNA polymerase-3 subunit gamma/tau